MSTYIEELNEELIPLDEAIAKYGPDEVIGGGGLSLEDVRGLYPHVDINVEAQFAQDGQPYFETLWIDVTNIRGDEEGGKFPHIPANGDEVWFVRRDGREYVVAWFD